MQACRDKNLCFNCDERYTRGHRCKPQFLLLSTFDTDDSLDESLSVDTTPAMPSEPEASMISLHAFFGQWTPQTFRVIRAINGFNVQILVDSGATHNFIQTRVAQFLQLPLQSTPSPLRVMVGNGEFLPCSNFFLNVTLHLAQNQFPIDLYPLEHSGTDVVLGVHWLTLISPYVMDYNDPFMRFMWNNTLVELQGDQGPLKSLISAHQLKRLQSTNLVEALFQVTMEPSPPGPHLTSPSHDINQPPLSPSTLPATQFLHYNNSFPNTHSFSPPPHHYLLHVPPTISLTFSQTPLLFQFAPTTICTSKNRKLKAKFRKC